MNNFIICCGMQRSGSSLQYNIAKELVESVCAEPVIIGWTPWQQFRKVYDNNKSHHDKVLLRTHPALYNYYPKLKHLFFDHNNFKFIYCYRNILDAISSLIRFGYDREQVLSHTVHSLIRTDTQWRQIPENKMLITRYEDFVDNLYILTKQISEFLYFDIPDTVIEQIANNNTLDKTKTKIENSSAKFNRETTYWHNHITNDGKANAYEQTLSKDEIRGLISRPDIKRWMENNHYDVPTT